MQETLNDLEADFKELQMLSSSAINTLTAYVRLLNSQRSYFDPQEHSYLLSRSEGVLAHFNTLCQRVESVLGECQVWRDIDVEKLIALKKSSSLLLRILYSDLGAILSLGKWQSPSFVHSLRSQAGVESGHITASSNDYKRDGHDSEAQYSGQFIRAYVDKGLHLAPQGYVTSSGMSAVTTALHVVLQKKTADDVAIVGKSTYFQNKKVIESFFPAHIFYIDEFDTEGVLALAREHNPLLIFFDSLCNAGSLAMPHLSLLVPRLAKILPRRSTLIIDNTALATACQPLVVMPTWPFGMSLFVVESLIKYHQFGFDRANAGIVWASAGSEQDIFNSRMHLGTIISDVSVQSLPVPDRVLLDSRLQRIGRNALRLAEKLESFTQEQKTIVERVIYPGLNSYNGYEWSKNVSFQGGFITLQFKSGYNTTKYYDAFVGRIIQIAKKINVDVVGGSSFGFNTTRIYVTARHAEGGADPFVRVSVGTETEYELQKVIDVFSEAIATAPAF